jgi:hexokinase
MDKASSNPGFHVFEKLITEKYLGDIAQRVINSLVHHSPPLLFNGISPRMLDVPHGVSTRSMAMIESANSIAEAKQSLIDHFEVDDLDTVSDEDAAIVKWICEQISTRAARLCSCAIAATLIQTGHARLGEEGSTDESKLLMAAQGRYDSFLVGRLALTFAFNSIIQLYPKFESRLRQSLASIVGKQVENRLEIGIVQGASMIGGAIIKFPLRSVT